MKKHWYEHCQEAINEVLRHWDPSGVIELMRKDGLLYDEYDSYAPGVLAALERGKNANGIGNHLAQVRSGSMALGCFRG